MTNNAFIWESFVFEDQEKANALQELLSESNATTFQLVNTACASSGTARLLSLLFSYDPLNNVVDKEKIISGLRLALKVYGNGDGHGNGDENGNSDGDDEEDYQCRYWNPESIDIHEIRVEYSHLFIVPPIPVKIYGRDYTNKTRTSQGERVSVLNFYKKVGLTIDMSVNEPADHLVCELEFLSYLYYYETLAWAVSDPKEAEEWQKIRHEFIDKHASFFMKEFSDLVKRNTLNPFFLKGAELLKLFVEHSSK